MWQASQEYLSSGVWEPRGRSVGCPRPVQAVSEQEQEALTAWTPVRPPAFKAWSLLLLTESFFTSYASVSSFGANCNPLHLITVKTGLSKMDRAYPK